MEASDKCYYYNVLKEILCKFDTQIKFQLILLIKYSCFAWILFVYNIVIEILSKAEVRYASAKLYVFTLKYKSIVLYVINLYRSIQKSPDKL